MMRRKFTPKVLTANHLLEGDVIYLAPGTVWTRRFSKALLIEDRSTAERLLKRAESDSASLVGACLVDAIRGPDGHPVPVHVREKLRARGPSNYSHGKQSETGFQVV